MGSSVLKLFQSGTAKAMQDAPWHSASPQLGQGANMALLDALALALSLARNKTINAALAEAIALRRQHVRLSMKSILKWLGGVVGALLLAAVSIITSTSYEIARANGMSYVPAPVTAAKAV